MAALPPDQLAAKVKVGTLYAKYATTVDPQSAHEIISQRMAAAAAVAATPMGGAGEPPNVSFGRAASVDAAIKAQQRAAAQELARAEREGRAQAKRDEAAQARQEREAAQASRQREREVAQIGNTVLRGVFGTLLGGSRRR